MPVVGAWLLAAAGAAILLQRPASPAVVTPGRTAWMVLELEVAPGFHVQADPASSEFLIPTSLTLHPGCSVIPGAPRYPPAQEIALAGTDEALAVYSSCFAIRTPLAAARGAPAQRCTLRGEVTYQACDDTRCLPPSTLPVKVNVDIRGAR